MEKYTEILKNELIAALGCTEPIAVAYAAAKAKELLGELPKKAIVSCSGNIIKNVKGVIVPTTSDMKGMAAAAAVGITGGDPNLGLEVLTPVNEESLAKAKELLDAGVFEERPIHTTIKLNIIVELFSEGHRSLVEIVHTHTGIVRMEKDDEVLLNIPYSDTEDSVLDYSVLNLKGIYEYAKNVPVDEIRELLLKQKEYNCTIASEGLKNTYGAAIGKTLLEMYGSDNPEIIAIASAAAGSDARMSGCEMPVVINSGSGNQGITISVPICIMAEKLGKTEEELLRSLAFGNLVSIYQKFKIGRLSAYCGAINASAGAGAGIAFLKNMPYDKIEQVIINAIAGVSGVVCDGAKPSCAAKIAAGLQASFMAVHLVENSLGFKNGDGLVKNGAEETIDCISRLAKEGMQITDEVIIDLMVPSEK